MLWRRGISNVNGDENFGIVWCWWRICGLVSESLACLASNDSRTCVSHAVEL